MSEATTLNDLIKSLPTVTDPSGKSVLLSDSLGALSRITNANLSRISVGSVDSNFGNALYDPGIFLCAAYSQSNRFINCLFAVFIVKWDTAINQAPLYVLGSSGGLTVQSCNAFGSPVFRMNDNSSVPSDLVLKYLEIKI